MIFFSCGFITSNFMFIFAFCKFCSFSFVVVVYLDVFLFLLRSEKKSVGSLICEVLVPC